MTKALADGRLAQETTIIEPLPAGTNAIGTIEMTAAEGLTYLGEQTIALDSAAAPATLPTGTNFVMIAAEGGAVRYTLNAAATANSGGYVPEDGYVYIVKIENLTSLSLYGVSPATAHLLYYQEP